MSGIDPHVMARADELAGRFRTASPFRHVAIEDFLDRAFCRRLLDEFPDFDKRHALNEMGEVGGKAVRMDVRDLSNAYRELDAYLQTPQFLGFVSRVTGIADLLYDPDYVGGGTHENRDGQSLDVHVDFNYHPRTRWHRRLNLIIYLNPHWETQWGGALELHPSPWNETQDEVRALAPTFNSCVIFETTEASWHGFSRIRLPEGREPLSRKSFAIYLYTRERPPEQTAPPHATIYVPEAMPRQLRAGHALDEDEVQDLSRRFSRMRTQLRYLYERERHFGAQMQALEHALDEMRAEQRLRLQGYATQPYGAQGLWADQWVGSQFQLRFVPTRAMRKLRLDLWSPPQLGSEQSLQIELAGRTYTQSLRPGLRTPLEFALPTRPGSEVALSIRASHTWTPATVGDSGDRRALAYRIVEAVLEH
jgi:hypothetical protein